MQILFISGRETTYTRNTVLARAFARFSDTDILLPGDRKSTLARSLVLPFLAAERIRRRKYDLVFVGFYGHLMMPLLSRLVQKPLLFDAFISTHDTLSGDRSRFRPDSIPGRLTGALDRSACLAADHVLLDTPLHIDYFVSRFAIPRQKFTAIPVGCNEDLFSPQPPPAGSDPVVLFYSSYQPLHGVESVVRAAARLQDTPLRFRLIGRGPTYTAARRLAECEQVRNIEFLPPVSIEAIRDEVAQATICLGGHFGPGDKADRVVPGKIYQLMAMEKAFIAADTSANRALLEQAVSALLVPRMDPEALANAVLKLWRNPALRRSLGAGALARFRREASEDLITQRLEETVRRMQSQPD